MCHIFTYIKNDDEINDESNGCNYQNILTKYLKYMSFEEIESLMCNIFNICNGGQLVFDSTKSMSLTDHIKKLNELNYCAMCSMSNIMSLTWYKKNR